MAGIHKRVTSLALRHSFDSPAPPAASPSGLRFGPSKMPPALGIGQGLMGHENITTTEIYLHVAMGANGLGVQSPLDTLKMESFASVSR